MVKIKTLSAFVCIGLLGACAYDAEGLTAKTDTAAYPGGSGRPDPNCDRHAAGKGSAAACTPQNRLWPKMR